MSAADLVRAIEQADPADAPALLAAIASLLAKRRLSNAEELKNVEPPDEALTLNEAAARIRRSKKWLYRHREALPFVRRLGPRSYMVSKQKLESWLARRPC
jgi:predicted DNA-binding transcriptional regulator AlpA